MENEFTVKLIDEAEEFIDKFVVPIYQTGRDVVLDSEYLKPLSIWKRKQSENKIDLFFHHLSQKTKEDKVDFIKNLKDNEKVFFAETISKIIDLNDNLQNYIMTCLVDKYKQNGDLNYYEKKLYYNINSLSEDDFKIYFCMYNKSSQEMKKYGLKTDLSIYIDMYDPNRNIIYTSLLRFSSIGILLLKSKSEQNDEPVKFYNTNSQIKTIEYFEISEYSKELFNYLKEYFKDEVCEEFNIPKSEFSKLF